MGRDTKKKPRKPREKVDIQAAALRAAELILAEQDAPRTPRNVHAAISYLRRLEDGKHEE
jgi:hypothetical protein